MKKTIAAIIIWYLLGVSGAIQFFRAEIDITGNEMVLALTLGGLVGPTSWLMVGLDHIPMDTILIHKEKKESN